MIEWVGACVLPLELSSHQQLRRRRRRTIAVPADSCRPRLAELKSRSPEIDGPFRGSAGGGTGDRGGGGFVRSIHLHDRRLRRQGHQQRLPRPPIRRRLPSPRPHLRPPQRPLHPGICIYIYIYICIITYLSSNLLTIDQFARSPTHACRSWRTRTHLALATHPWGSFSTGMYAHWSIHPSIPWDVAHQQVSILHKYTSLTLACIYMIWYDSSYAYLGIGSLRSPSLLHIHDCIGYICAWSIYYWSYASTSL